MTRAEIRSFLNAGVTAVDSSISFQYGRLSEFNSKRNTTYPVVFWESSPSVSVDLSPNQLPMSNWPITLHIMKLDKADSLPAQYEALVDDCDYIAQQLIYQYNQIQSNTYYSGLSFTDIIREPRIKKNADDMTGVILSFTLIDPDKTELC